MPIEEKGEGISERAREKAVERKVNVDRKLNKNKLEPKREDKLGFIYLPKYTLHADVI